MKKEKVYIFLTELLREVPDTFSGSDVSSEKRKCELATGEYLLSYALKSVYGLELSDLRRERTELGKPYFVDRADIHYNISHSGDYMICAIGNCPMGVDIQQHRSLNLPRMAKRNLSPAEYAIWEKSEHPLEQFYEFWVQKESYLKWTGEGITKDLRSLPMDGTGRMLNVPEGYSGALWCEVEVEVEVQLVTI